MKKRRGRRRDGISKFKAGIIGIVLIVLFSYAAYTKFANPIASKFTINAVFSSASGLNPNSLVRIAGVNVGTVASVAPVASCGKQKDCQAANVTMTIQDQGLPIHDDATFSIRPRIFLEGNFFVDVNPGSPSAAVIHDGHTFPINQGTEPVQLDQVLTSLQTNTRQDLQLLLKEYGSAVKQAGPAYNASIQYWLPAYEYSAIVAHDALGIQPHDLSNWIDKMGSVAGALDAHPKNLQSLITDFNTTAGAFARQNVALQNTVAELPKTLNAAIPAFNALNAAFPPLRKLARTLIPGVKSTGPTIDASLPFITQLRLLVQPSELRGLTKDLSVTVPKLASLTNATIPLMRNGIRPASSCVANVVIPWSQLTLNDPHFNASNGFPPHKAYVEAVDFLPGLAGESRNFDANGPYIRILGALGDTVTQTVSSGLVGGALAPLIGAQPQLPPGGHRPPLQPNVPCETQAPITDLSATAAAAPQTITTGSPVPGFPLPIPPITLLQRKQAQTARVALMSAVRQGLSKQGVIKPQPASQAATAASNATRSASKAGK